MVEGLSKINYKGKEIIYACYTQEIGSNKDKTVALINGVTEEYLKHPDKSVLGLTNVQHLHFDMDILKVFKGSQDQINKKYKKLAIVGVKGLIKVAYNFVMGLTAQGSSIKAMDTEEEAKEWLVSE